MLSSLVRRLVPGFAAALVIAGIVAGGAPASVASPLAYTVTGSSAGFGTSITGSFSLSAPLTGSGGNIALSSFSIVDSTLGVTWDQTDSISAAYVSDTGLLSSSLLHLGVSDNYSLSLGAPRSLDLILRLDGTVGLYNVYGGDSFWSGTATIAPVAAVPEPATLAILGLGLAGLGLGRRRRVRKVRA